MRATEPPPGWSGGARLILSSIVIGGLVLLGVPSMAVADDAVPPADAVVAEASAPEAEPAPVAEPVEVPVAEPEPVAEPAPEPAAEPEPEPAAEPPVPESAAVPEASSETVVEVPVEAPAQARVMAAGEGGPPVTIPEWKDHVDICHSTRSESNPFVFISPSVRSIIDGDDTTDDKKAHSVHHDFADIIPAFWYFDAEHVEQFFPGLNTTKTEITEADCNPAPPSIEVFAAICTEPGGTPPLVLVTLAKLLVGFEYTLTVVDTETHDEVAFKDFTVSSMEMEFPFSLVPGSFTVTLHRVGDDVTKDLVKNVTVVPCPPPPVPGWELMKSSDPADGETVEAGDMITYYLDAENTSEATVDDAQAFDDITDVLDNATLLELGPGLVQDGNQLTWTVPSLEPGESAQTWYTVQVGEDVVGELLHNVVAPGPGGECPDVDGEEVARDGNGSCVVDHPVKSIGLDGMAQCVNDTPWFMYAITPYGIEDTAANPISLIWWTPAAFAGRDPSIPADDVAALLADGASQVDAIPYPSGWMSGDTISGQQLWPGAEVDAEGNPTDWPGWTLQADGTWVLDPSAPFYDLRSEAVVEIRINPSNDAIAVYPPPTPNCNAAPPQNPPSSTPAGGSPTALAESGSDALAMLPAGALLLLAGSAALGFGARRRVRA
ncbi:DUF11 domain-containing protein [Agromyces fucosus]|uniref:DUF11 domain-containing protein n=1 Tax=Agromyces fucosus TaxID=41985 RepID=A0A4Q2JW92_9MICO|nr:DUF11 domain-containing protein [Agromyces fucosus]RXZ51069.1 DUF11 domain-containing protein [Agromyces fucosus]